MKRIPLATYRLQFGEHLTFQKAAALADYLRDLGISDLYASPLFKAGPQSTHGYDVCDFGQLSPKLGTVADFNRFGETLRNLGLGLLLDMVPNHMGADPSNSWWLDVLEKGPASPYASWFDIDWHPLNPDLRGKVLLPVLEDHYATVLEAGKLRIISRAGGLAVAYSDRSFPISADGHAFILGHLLADRKKSAKSKASGNGNELLHRFSRRQAVTPEARAEFLKARQGLRPSLVQSGKLRERLAVVLRRLNGKRGFPQSFGPLHALLREQPYRLAYWRSGTEEINYRRFFDVAGLISLRMELPQVFQATHEFLLKLIREGKVTGLRIDHPDGLWNPKGYFDRLQQSAEAPLYVVVEKILAGDECLPRDWPVDGTTGYDFLNQLNGLFVRRDSQAAFDKLYFELIGASVDFPQLLYRAKERILQNSFASELGALSYRCKRIAGQTRYGQDLTLAQLRAGLLALVAAFPVYRTYASEETRQLPRRQGEYIHQAIRFAQALNPKLDPSAFDFLKRLLLLEDPEDFDESTRKQARESVMRFQQLTGPVMAKGLEDTAFYRFNRLESVNEVGGDPGVFGTSLEEFHAHNESRAQNTPHSLLASSTHDTKRGEDVRARLNVLSEMPQEWRKAVLRWSDFNTQRKSLVHGQLAPDPNEEYLLYQTLVGAWPADAGTSAGLASFRARVADYMRKAIREAKVHTSWRQPDPAYERAMHNFVKSLLANSSRNLFLKELKLFQRRVAFFGVFNSLSQVLLKMTSPGVPDFYQGTELWDLNLVDPDNRRPVDYEVRRGLLAGLQQRMAARTDPSEMLASLLAKRETGQVKLFLIWRTLRYRRAHAELFQSGDYVPLYAEGPRKAHVCAFARVRAGKRVVVVAPRLMMGLAGGKATPPMGEAIWRTTLLKLPGGFDEVCYHNILTGESLESRRRALPLAEVLKLFPVALLEAK